MNKLKYTQIPSLVLAGLLHFAPVCRLAQTAPALASAPMIMVLRLAAVVAAAFGSVHAVSGASAVLITSSTNTAGTNGTAYSYRITESSPSADPGVWFGASPLPPGLTINTNTGQITGIPTQMGVTVVHLTSGFRPENLFAIPTNMTLTVRGKPTIQTQPASQSALGGGPASFSVIATGLPPPSYRWRLNGGTLAGQTNASLALSNLTAGQAGPYTVVVSNMVGSVTSVVATLTISSVTPVTITNEPQGRTVAAGSAVSFSVGADGTPPLTYQWRKNGADIAAATSSSLTFASTAPADTGDYTVVVSNAAGPVPSQAAHLGVIPLPQFAPLELMGNQLVLRFDRAAGASYEILQTETLPGAIWSSLTNFPTAAAQTPTTVTLSTGASATKFFRIRMTIP